MDEIQDDKLAQNSDRPVFVRTGEIESGLSVEAAIAPQDTVPAAIPQGLSATPGDGRAALSRRGSLDRDIFGYDVYLSTSRRPRGGRPAGRRAGLGLQAKEGPLVPGDPGIHGFTTGTADDKLYLLSTGAGKAKALFGVSTVAKGSWPQLMRMTKNGRRLFVSMNLADKVVALDTSKPELRGLPNLPDMGTESGPHDLAPTGDEKRLVVSDRFTRQDDFGKVHSLRDHKAHVARVSAGEPVPWPRLQPAYGHGGRERPARPHGVAFRRLA